LTIPITLPYKTSCNFTPKFTLRGTPEYRTAGRPSAAATRHPSSWPPHHLWCCCPRHFRCRQTAHHQRCPTCKGLHGMRRNVARLACSSKGVRAAAKLQRSSHCMHSSGSKITYMTTCRCACLGSQLVLSCMPHAATSAQSCDITMQIDAVRRLTCVPLTWGALPALALRCRQLRDHTGSQCS
jgi:hypothetical protein